MSSTRAPSAPTRGSTPSGSPSRRRACRTRRSTRRTTPGPRESARDGGPAQMGLRRRLQAGRRPQKCTRPCTGRGAAEGVAVLARRGCAPVLLRVRCETNCARVVLYCTRAGRGFSRGWCRARASMLRHIDTYGVATQQVQRLRMQTSSGSPGPAAAVQNAKQSHNIESSAPQWPSR